MPWHVCGTPGRSLALAVHNQGSPYALTWDFVCAPSATRTRDLLLRRQLLCPLSYRGHGDRPAGCPAAPSVTAAAQPRAGQRSE